MPRAGFYTVESGKISFRKDGNWYSDEERIDNPRIALLFSHSIRQNPDGSWFLQVAEERASIAVEDTPYVVKSIDPIGDDLGLLSTAVHFGSPSYTSQRPKDVAVTIIFGIQPIHYHREDKSSTYREESSLANALTSASKGNARISSARSKCRLGD